MGNLQRVTPILNLILTQNLNKMNMIIYEVNLSIDTALETSFIAWLKTHINEMLKFDGFIDASLFMDVENNHTSKIGWINIKSNRRCIWMITSTYMPNVCGRKH